MWKKENIRKGINVEEDCPKRGPQKTTEDNKLGENHVTVVKL
jgi:hypothetical protein